MSGQLHACEEMDDFFSLYLVANLHKAIDYGFGFEDETPWQAQERTNSTITISLLLSPFHDHLDDDYEKDSGTQSHVLIQKLTRKICTDRDLLSLHQCTIARRFRNLQVEMKLCNQA